MNLRLLPPGPLFAAWNRRTVERFAAGLRDEWARICLVTYTPTPAIRHLLHVLDPWLSAYVCVHNYAATPGISRQVVESERRLGHDVDEVFCDAKYLADLWSERLGRPVPRLMPACDPGSRSAGPGEATNWNRHGRSDSSAAASRELDLACYRAAIDAGFELTFIGPPSRQVAEVLGKGVVWKPPVANADPAGRPFAMWMP